MEVITKILSEMKKQNITQKNVVDSLGISQTAFSDWKAGRSKSYMKYLPKIASVLGVSVDYLLGRDEKAPDPEEPDQEQSEVSMEFADRVSRLSDAGREALSQYLDLLLRSEGKP